MEEEKETASINRNLLPSIIIVTHATDPITHSSFLFSLSFLYIDQIHHTVCVEENELKTSDVYTTTTTTTINVEQKKNIKET